MSYQNILRQRRQEVEDPVLEDILEEATSNWNQLALELEEPTLIHGSDTENFQYILEEGLKPGSQNSGRTGRVPEMIMFSQQHPFLSHSATHR